MRYLLVSIFLVLSNITSAQVKLELKLIDNESGKAVAYANVGIMEKNIGTVSNAEGYFSLSAQPEDIIRISSIGYESISFTAGELSGKELCMLKPIDYQLGIIEIQASRFQDNQIMLGLKNKKRGESIGFGSAQLGTEIGSVIEIDKPFYVQSANFALNHAKGDSLFLRLNIYSFSEGKIGEKVLRENVFLEDIQRRGLYEIDMTPYDLVLEEDVLISLEWLRNYDEMGNKDITFDTKKAKKNKGIYVRYSSNGTFQKLNHLTKKKVCFHLIGLESH